MKIDPLFGPDRYAPIESANAPVVLATLRELRLYSASAINDSKRSLLGGMVKGRWFSPLDIGKEGLVFRQAARIWSVSLNRSDRDTPHIPHSWLQAALFVKTSLIDALTNQRIHIGPA